MQISVATTYTAAVRCAKRNDGLIRKIVTFQKRRDYARSLPMPYRISYKNDVVIFHIRNLAFDRRAGVGVGLLFIGSAACVIFQVVGSIGNFWYDFIERAFCFRFDMFCYLLGCVGARKVGYQYIAFICCRRIMRSAVVPRTFIVVSASGQSK